MNLKPDVVISRCFQLNVQFNECCLYMGKNVNRKGPLVFLPLRTVQNMCHRFIFLAAFTELLQIEM